MYSRVTDAVIQIKNALTPEEITELKNDTDLKTIQFSSDIELKTFQRMNDLLFSTRADVGLRIYGYYQSVCDLGFLQHLTNLKRLYVECHERVENIEALAYLGYLTELNLSIYSLETFDILSMIPEGLQKLILGDTKSKKPSLAVIERFTDLRELVIVGHTKHIDVVGKLLNLEKLTLTSVTTKSLEFLKPLNRLTQLSVNFGGIKNFSAVEGMVRLQFLELFQIRGLSDLSFISTLSGLQYLSLQNLPNVQELPALNLPKLRKVALDNMKGLNDLHGLGDVPALEEFTHWSAMNRRIDDYLPILRNPSLKRISVGFGSDKKNKQFEELAKNHGKTDQDVWKEFIFFT